MTLGQTTRAHKGKKGMAPRTVYLRVGIWLNSKTGQIHIASLDKRFRHTTVSNDPESKRYHANLFEKLEAVLKDEGRWS